MATAAVMLAHQVASKAFRDAAFLSVWPTTALPIMIASAAIAVVAAVPLFARLLERYGPRFVVSAGFVISAIGHAVEWQLSSGRPWVAVLIYLHVAGLGATSALGILAVVTNGSIREARGAVSAGLPPPVPSAAHSAGSPPSGWRRC